MGKKAPKSTPPKGEIINRPDTPREGTKSNSMPKYENPPPPPPKK